MQACESLLKFQLFNILVLSNFVVIEGRHLNAPNSSSLYCAIMCGKDRVKTKKIQGEANPIWMQDFKLSIEKKEKSNEKSKRSWVDGVVVDVYESKKLLVTTGMVVAFLFWPNSDSLFL